MALSAGLIILALSLWVFLGLLPLRVLLHWLSIPPPHRALQLSLGFVLGAAVTAAAFMVGSEHPRLIALGVAAASLSAAWYYFYLGSKSKEHCWRDDTGLAAYNTYSALGVIFAVLLCLHLALILAENLTRSVYPWDAWTTWIYRSKLWFFNGEIAPLLPPALWLSEGDQRRVRLRPTNIRLLSLLLPYTPQVLPTNGLIIGLIFRGACAPLH